MTHNNNLYLPSHEDYAQEEQEEQDMQEEQEERVQTGRVKAAVLPMGGPASRRVKREVQGGALAKSESSLPLVFPAQNSQKSKWT